MGSVSQITEFTVLWKICAEMRWLANLKLTGTWKEKADLIHRFQVHEKTALQSTDLIQYSAINRLFLLRLRGLDLNFWGHSF